MGIVAHSSSLSAYDLTWALRRDKTTPPATLYRGRHHTDNLKKSGARGSWIRSHLPENLTELAPFFVSDALSTSRQSGCRGFTGPVPLPLWIRVCPGIYDYMVHIIPLLAGAAKIRFVRCGAARCCVRESGVIILPIV